MSGTAELHPTLLYHLANTLGWPALRPLQEAAIDPILQGHDILLLGQTAGGKTEAALLPLLTRMAHEDWRGTSVLYLCPLRALLNDLEPRISGYCGWVGRRASLWHGDVSYSRRRKMLSDAPDILLTTPESVEGILVSSWASPQQAFAGLRAVVIDEVHAFAGDDRGWHLLAILERLTRLAGRPLQRIALSATVGNPDRLLEWLQGSNRGHQSRHVVAAPPSQVPPEIVVDHVGSIENAATVIAALHRGEKRLAFCQSRRSVEELTLHLRAHGVQAFPSHSSLSAEERRQAERAFAESSDCVIVATSTLELGIDVGDLDRVIQIDAPSTVSSFLQRLGRSGRRHGTAPYCLFLTTEQEQLLQVAGVLLLWGSGWVERIHVPSSPRHILAQQLLALALQEGQVGMSTWHEWLSGAGLFGADDAQIVAHLIEQGFLERDDDMVFVGPAAEKVFGRRHFMALTSVFTSAPELTALQGRREIGRIHPLTLATASGPPTILLAGRTWVVTHIDWARHLCYVAPTTTPGRSRWQGVARPRHHQLTRAMQRVVLGEEPRRVSWSRRAASALESARRFFEAVTEPGATVVTRDARGGVRWWTWAGAGANSVLGAALAECVDRATTASDLSLRLSAGVDGRSLAKAVATVVGSPLPLPSVRDEAIDGLKFGKALPKGLARKTLAERLGDADGARVVLDESVITRE